VERVLQFCGNGIASASTAFDKRNFPQRRVLPLYSLLAIFISPKLEFESRIAIRDYVRYAPLAPVALLFRTTE